MKHIIGVHKHLKPFLVWEFERLNYVKDASTKLFKREKKFSTAKRHKIPYTKSASRVVPDKRCSLPNSSWLGNLEKMLSSLEIWAIWGTPFFDNFLIFVMYSDNNYFKLDKVCLQLSYELLFAIYSVLFSYIQHFKFPKRCSFSFPSWLEKEKEPSWHVKVEHLVQ